MTLRRKKTLPKDFDAIVRSGDLTAMRQVFERSAITAYGNASSRTPALSFFAVPDEFVVWLVQQGADVDQPDAYGETPLHQHAGSWRGNPSLILQLGADLHARDRNGRTALFDAMTHPRHVATLITAGIDVDAVDDEGRTALEARLRGIRPHEATEVSESVSLLLAAGATLPEGLSEEIRGLSEDFERLRPDFAPDSLEDTEAAIRALCAIVGVEPAGQRVPHDGVSRITIETSEAKKDSDPEDVFGALWDLLVPGMGAALSVQGEAVRIVGRLTDEIHHQGGVNWDRDFSRMLAALPALLAQHTDPATSTADLPGRVAGHARAMRGGQADLPWLLELRRLVTAWVLEHPEPIPLPPQDYRR